MASGLDVKDRFVRWFVMSPLQPVAQDVWVVRGGLPDKIMNVYFIRDGSGVLAFDAGIRAMTRGIAAAAALLGGLTRGPAAARHHRVGEPEE
jgi:hypothetical protein